MSARRTSSQTHALCISSRIPAGSQLLLERRTLALPSRIDKRHARTLSLRFPVVEVCLGENRYRCWCYCTVANLGKSCGDSPLGYLGLNGFFAFEANLRTAIRYASSAISLPSLSKKSFAKLTWVIDGNAFRVPGYGLGGGLGLHRPTQNHLSPVFPTKRLKLSKVSHVRHIISSSQI